jgi:hypothetical protein
MVLLKANITSFVYFDELSDNLMCKVCLSRPSDFAEHFCSTSLLQFKLKKFVCSTEYLAKHTAYQFFKIISISQKGEEKRCYKNTSVFLN